MNYSFLLRGLKMDIYKLPPDIWRIIAKWLSKSDLIALQLTNTKMMKFLDKISDIWWGKHLLEYQQRWDEYYNRRDKILEEQLIRVPKENTKNIIRNILISQKIVLVKNLKYSRHMDTIHDYGTCDICDSQYYVNFKIIEEYLSIVTQMFLELLYFLVIFFLIF
jgi:hypothetical protein